MSATDAGVWLQLAILTDFIARMKGRGTVGFFVGGILFGPLALLCVLCARRNLDVLRARLDRLEQKDRAHNAPRGDQAVVCK